MRSIENKQTMTDFLKKRKLALSLYQCRHWLYLLQKCCLGTFSFTKTSNKANWIKLYLQ